MVDPGCTKEEYLASLGPLELDCCIEAIKAIAKTTKRTKKLEILQQAWHSGTCNILFELFHLAYDPTRTFGVKKVPTSTPHNPGFFSDDWLPKTHQEFLELIERLVNRTLTGNEMTEELQVWSKICTAEVWDLLYAPCLRRDMRCGIDKSTFNTLIDTIGTEAVQKYKIKASLDARFLGVQLAKDGKDTGDKYKKGKMIADAKYDGSRLLTIVDVHNNTVTQYTRGGIVNNNFPHIRQYFQKLIPRMTESWCFDGEIMDPDDFGGLMTQFNRKYDVDTEACYYILFDAFPYKDYEDGEVKLPYYTRIVNLHAQWGPHVLDVSEGKIQVNPYEVLDFGTPEGHKRFKELNDLYLRSKKEGIMLKQLDGTYTAGKRTDAWIKFKPKIQVTLKIVGYFPGKKGTKNEVTFGSLILEGNDWDPADQCVKFIEVKADGFPEDIRAWIWENRDACMGRLCEIEADKVQQEKNQIGTNNWSLRFPKWKSWRDTMDNPGVKV